MGPAPCWSRGRALKNDVSVYLVDGLQSGPIAWVDAAEGFRCTMNEAEAKGFNGASCFPLEPRKVRLANAAFALTYLRPMGLRLLEPRKVVFFSILFHRHVEAFNGAASAGAAEGHRQQWKEPPVREASMGSALRWSRGRKPDFRLINVGRYAFNGAALCWRRGCGYPPDLSPTWRTSFSMGP